MRILIFTENTHVGGLDSFLATLINNWPYPDDFTVMCNESHPGFVRLQSRVNRKCEFVAHRLPLHWAAPQRVSRRNAVSLARSVAGLLWKYALFMYHPVALSIIFRRGNFDRLLVVNGGYPAGQTCLAASIAWGMTKRRPRSVHNFHNFASATRWWDGWVENVIDALVLHYSSAVVSVSSSCAGSMVIRRAFRTTNKLGYIYNGVNMDNAESYAPAQIKSSLGIPEDAPMCLMLGTYEPRKGHAFLFRAFKLVLKEVPAAQLVVCGYGYPQEIEQVQESLTAEGLEQSVHLQGFREDVPALLDATDVLVVSSQAYESFGLMIVEARAKRVPVVATRVGGIPEVLTGGDGGYLVDPDDADGFAAHIVKLLTDPQDRMEQGRRGYDLYQNNFTSRRMAQQYADLVRNGERSP